MLTIVPVTIEHQLLVALKILPCCSTHRVFFVFCFLSKRFNSPYEILLEEISSN